MIRLGDRPEATLRRAGQPVERTRTWRWCAGAGREDDTRRVVAGFTAGPQIGIVASTLRAHRAGPIRPGAPLRRLRRHAERLRPGLWVRRAGNRSSFVYRVRERRVREVGVAARAIARRPAVLRRHLVG
ncbi:MAG TPA: hypothetical protein VK919_05355 [Solirubrobacterales bacterium]|nr:hypothetical protein [Solirubrobacterales bacterium]